MKKSIDYRAEIDGLRAIAVFSVIFYHSSVLIFEKKLLPGGFVGVDIFFVISGYLITKIITNEYQSKRDFSFLNFYVRRIRRILPALLFVIIVTFPFIYLKTPPNYILDYLKSIISINLFVSNIFFWDLGYGYDQLQNVQFQPFLHAWTLSLEEQFYIFFPIFYFFIYKKLNKYLLSLIIIGFFLSLLLSDYASYAHSALNFYILPTRAWEFLIGSIIFLLETKKTLIKKNVSSIFIFIGFFFIFISIFYFDDKMYLPSILSLIPVLGTSFIIFFKYDDNYFIKILKSKILTYSGKISYSLYLWHFPIFILYPNLNFFFQMIIIFTFSIISYYLVEQNFRYNIKYNFFSVKTVLITNFLVICLMFYFLTVSKEIDYEKYPVIFHQILKQKANFNTESEFDSDQILFNSQKRNLYIAGDSHMVVLWESLRNDERVINKFNLIDKNLGNGCYYVYNFYKIDFFTKKKLNPCTLEDQKKRRENFISKKDSIVILGGRLPLWLNSKPDRQFFRYLEKKNDKFSKLSFMNDEDLKLEDGVRNSIYDLLENDIKVILIYPVPILNFFPSKKLFDLYLSDKENFQENLKNRPFVISYSDFKKYAKQSHDLLNSISHPNLIKIYTHELFCDEILDLCITHDENEIFYLDDDHLSKFGNIKIIDQIFKELNEG